VVLCLIENCVGISIVWSANCGFSLVTYYYFAIKNEVYKNKSKTLKIKIGLIFTFLYCIVIWIYYCIVEHFITTVAHICAFLLGFLIGFFYQILILKKISQQINEKTQSLLVNSNDKKIYYNADTDVNNLVVCD
jgi:putative Mn2+ efflux pump MntP